MQYSRIHYSSQHGVLCCPSSERNSHWLLQYSVGTIVKLGVNNTQSEECTYRKISSKFHRNPREYWSTAFPHIPIEENLLASQLKRPNAACSANNNKLVMRWFLTRHIQSFLYRRHFLLHRSQAVFMCRTIEYNDVTQDDLPMLPVILISGILSDTKIPQHIAHWQKLSARISSYSPQTKWRSSNYIWIHFIWYGTSVLAFLSAEQS